jgi:hypothetical protein
VGIGANAAIFTSVNSMLQGVIEFYKQDGKPLPPPTSGRDFANKMQNVA